MIQWIALAVALDADGKASSAQRAAKRANDYANLPGSSTMVILRDFELVDVPVRKSNGFWDGLFVPTKQVLGDKPHMEYSVPFHYIQNLKQQEDDDGNKFVRVSISEYAGLKNNGGNTIIGAYIPGTLEEVSAVLSGKPSKRKRKWKKRK